MALSNAERQRRHYDRQKKARKMPGDALAPYLRRPFFVFYQENSNSSEVEIPLRLAGTQPVDFTDDLPAQFPRDLEGPVTRDSLQRAELAVECLADAARALAQMINDYKRQEISARIAEIENANLSDPAAKRQVLAGIVRLQKMLALLDRQVRWTFPQWKVAGE